MKQLFLNVKTGEVEHIETPKPLSKENHVIVETEYSIISAGTERTLTSFGNKNLIQKAMERPDQVKKVTEKMSTDGVLTTLESAFTRLGEPMPIGYSGVGKIIEVGKNVNGYLVGDRVAMAGQAYHSEINRVNKNLISKIPKDFQNFEQGAFCALGGIALHGIHQADVKPGETVAVIGMGLLGHITSRILNAYGSNVIGFDVVDKTLPNTKLKAFIKSNDESAVDLVNSHTNGFGVDKVIITAAANSNDPMDLAAAICRDKGIICMIGVTKMDIDRRPYYEKELTFTIARSYGPGRYEDDYENKGIDYPIGHVRFTEGRNIEEFVRLFTENRADFSDLITHYIPFEEAKKGYEMITTNVNKERYIGILLKYSSNNESKFNNTISSSTPSNTTNEKLSIGLIGAGNFVRNTMLPQMRNTNKYHFRGLATTGGPGAAQTNKVFPFDYSTNNYKEILEDPEIDLIAISTQHNTHAKFIIEALNAGKHVYCEKPLCLNLNELQDIKKAYESSPGELFCGLNRRHAPLIQQVKQELQTEKHPAIYNYIANAGEIPSSHWTQDELFGGGRIIGEAIHFVDTIQSMDGSSIVELDIKYLENENYPSKDNVIISMKMDSGAIGNIIYTSAGSSKYPKEFLQVFSNGKIYEMDNYLKLTKYGIGKKSKVGLKQDKGMHNEYLEIYNKTNNISDKKTIIDIFENHYFLLRGMENGSDADIQ